MKKTLNTANGTSHHGQVFITSRADLEKVFGPPHYEDGPEEKVQAEWVFETQEGDVFTIYDWKEYRHYSPQKAIEWHVGAHTSGAAHRALQEIEDALKNNLPLELEEAE